MEVMSTNHNQPAITFQTYASYDMLQLHCHNGDSVIHISGTIYLCQIALTQQSLTEPNSRYRSSCSHSLSLEHLRNRNHSQWDLSSIFFPCALASTAHIYLKDPWPQRLHCPFLQKPWTRVIYISGDGLVDVFLFIFFKQRAVSRCDDLNWHTKLYFIFWKKPFPLRFLFSPCSAAWWLYFLHHLGAYFFVECTRGSPHKVSIFSEIP